MHCPYCRHTDSKVLDSRTAEDGGSIRRRRQCPACERRFTTVEQMQIVVVKRSGVVEPFNRDKVISGVRKAFPNFHEPGSFRPQGTKRSTLSGDAPGLRRSWKPTAGPLKNRFLWSRNLTQTKFLMTDFD